MRILRRWTRLGVYGAFVISIPLYRLFLGLSVTQLTVVVAVALFVAVAAVEGAFRQGFRVRKRAAYPAAVRAQLGSFQAVSAAARHALLVVHELLAARASFIAMQRGDINSLEPIAASGMDPEDAERLLEAARPAVSESMASHEAVAVDPPDLPPDASLRRGERLFLVPLVALQQPIGTLAVVGKPAGDLMDRQLLNALGPALGLSLENLRQREELRESETRQRLMIGQMPAILWTTDRDLRFTSSLGNALAGLHLQQNQVAGMDLFEYFQTDDPEYGPIEAHRRALAGESVTYESEWVGRTYHCHVEPMRDGEERAVGCVGVALDITERKRAEDALRDSEERLRTVISSAPITLFAVDCEGRVTLSEGHSGPVTRALGGIIGRSIFEAYGQYIPQLEERFQRALSGGDTWAVVEIGEVTYDCRYSPLRDDGGEVKGVIGVAVDVTERKRAEEALRESETLYSSLVETSPDAVLLTDSAGKVLMANRRAAELVGLTGSQELLGKSALEFIAPEQRDRLRHSMRATSTEEFLRSVEFALIRQDGVRFPAELSVSRVLDADGKPKAVMAIARDITERKRAEETIRHLAYHDALTNLPNRALLKDRLTLALAQARRNEQMVAVMFLDLDRFKLVNDTAGHSVGDQLLQAVAERLGALVREGDTVARVGGDEFTLLLAGIDRVEDAVQVAERVLDALRQPRVMAGHEFHITTSIGVTIYPNDGADAETLLRNADGAMYRAKEQGRNNYQLHTPATNARILERLALENSLRRGLEREEFVVYYQPLVNIDRGRIAGVEALVRWQHPERGLVAPGEFIPLAEETGLIVPLGEWVLRTACGQTRAWQERGLQPLRVAVNLSARQFQQPNLVEMIAQVLGETDLAPQFLALEITESIAMQDADFTIAMLGELRRMGVQISIDDFGTGYSSLSYLKRFPIDALKIDRSFVRDIADDPDDAAIVTSVIALAENLKLKVIAEGVETEEQLRFLKERRCMQMQGYLFSRPVPAEALERMLASGKLLVGSAAEPV